LVISILAVSPQLEIGMRDFDLSELEALALEGLNSGAPIEPASGYWEEKHRRLVERLKKTSERQISHSSQSRSGLIAQIKNA
jgi:hypothetical protein